MSASKKLRKLIRDPNRFFYDMFAKRVGSPNVAGTAQLSRIAGDSKFQLDETTHPWIQLARQFGLRSGATTGRRDQSMLVQIKELYDVLEYILRIAHARGSGLRVYTLKGAYEFEIDAISTWNMAMLEKLYKGVRGKPDFVVEMVGGDDSIFALHLFLYTNRNQWIEVRSASAHIRRIRPELFSSVYPAARADEDGAYEFDTNGPLDAVYTWVNQADPDWQEMWASTFPNKKINADRYASKDELRYSLRSLARFAPWLRTIYVVSNCAPPDWLAEHPNLVWVDHKEIFPDPSVLPVFNSHAIEACLHKVPGISQRFIYLNDDFLLVEPCYYTDFFDDAGRSVSYLEPYGMVAQDNHFDHASEYLAPAIKSQRLLRKKYPDWPATQLHKHCPYALRRDVMERAEKYLGDELVNTRAAKSRTNEDINLPSFFYHHFALAAGDAIDRPVVYRIVRPETVDDFADMKTLRRNKFLCFNDGDGSAQNQHYLDTFQEIMENFFPDPSPFEKRIG